MCRRQISWTPTILNKAVGEPNAPDDRLSLRGFTVRRVGLAANSVVSEGCARAVTVIATLDTSGAKVIVSGNQAGGIGNHLQAVQVVVGVIDDASAGIGAGEHVAQDRTSVV